MLTLPLADEVFLVSHDDYSGKPRLGPPVLGTLLAGAVLAELALAQRVTVAEDSTIRVLDQRKHGERLTDAAMAEILKPRDTYTVRIWVQHLREHAAAMVALRLIEAGLLAEESGRSRRPARYQPIDPLKAGAPAARLRYLIGRPEEADEQGAVLGGLVAVVGLESVVLGSSPQRVRETLIRAAQTLRPDLRSLIAGVDSVLVSMALGR
jgi:hypothetical protein